jgi:hypothetical protein
MGKYQTSNEFPQRRPLVRRGKQAYAIEALSPQEWFLTQFLQDERGYESFA